MSDFEVMIVECNQCGARLRVKSKSSEKRIACPKCKSIITVLNKPTSSSDPDTSDLAEKASDISDEDTQPADTPTHGRLRIRVVVIVATLGVLIAALPLTLSGPEAPSTVENQFISQAKQTRAGKLRQDDTGRTVEREFAVTMTSQDKSSAEQAGEYKYTEYFDRNGLASEWQVVTPRRTLKGGRGADGKPYRDLTVATAPSPLTRPSIQWASLAMGLLLTSSVLFIVWRSGTRRGIAAALSVGIVCLLCVAFSSFAPWVTFRKFTINVPGEPQTFRAIHGVIFSTGKIVFALCIAGCVFVLLPKFPQSSRPSRLAIFSLGSATLLAIAAAVILFTVPETVVRASSESHNGAILSSPSAHEPEVSTGVHAALVFAITAALTIATATTITIQSRFKRES